MKKIIYIVFVGLIFASCKPAEVAVAPVTYEVDDFYILMTDAFHLRAGMEYQEVKQVLKQDPFEIHQNINDNCIILSYHMKRNKRIHTSSDADVPLTFYPSDDKTNLTFDGSKMFYLILDTDKKTLRTFFSDPSQENVAKYTMLLRRSKRVCDNPASSEDFMRLWTVNEVEVKAPAMELSLKSFLK